MKKMSLKKASVLVLCSLFMCMGTINPVSAKSTDADDAAQTSAIKWSALNLSPAQVKQINILRLDFSKKAVKLKADIVVKKLEIEKLLMSPSANPNQLNQLLQDKLKLESELQKESLNNFLAIKKLLTPQQLMQLPKARVIR